MVDHFASLRNKVLYQSQNRGCREMDIIIGRFAQEYVDHMDEDELKLFLKILALDDADIYDWYSKKTSIPTKYDTSLMRKLLKFKLTRNEN